MMDSIVPGSDCILYESNPVIVRDSIKNRGPDAIRGLDACHDKFRDTKIPQHEIKLRPDERTHSRFMDHVLPGSRQQFVNDLRTRGPLNGKRLFFKEILPEDFDIGTVPAVDPENMENRVISCTKLPEYLKDPRDYGPGLCHVERSAVQDEIILHINDE